MKILLHMGQGKTGTTALQQSLHGSVEALRARGILYPRFGGKAIAHHLLMPLCGATTKLPLWTLNDLGGPEEALRKARDAWAATCDDIGSNAPDILILSSELLVGGTDRAEKARLFGALSSHSDDIQPILYVRHPVDFYRSALQEMLKAVSRPKPPVCLNLREKIEDIEAVFPRPPVLVAYDKSSLLQGDTISDFANRFLAPRIGASDLPSQRANPGLSSEALILMSQLRAEGGDTVEAARRVARLKPQLLAFDHEDPPSQPFTLHPEVAEAALRSATCHRWLAETGRLTIPGLDAARIDGAAPPDWMLTAAPETLFEHDPQRLKRLRNWMDRSGSIVRLRKGKDTSRKRRTLLDRILRFVNRRLAAITSQASLDATDRQNRETSEAPGDGPVT